ncbi:prepilin-type N-terminal cleavage/methylation domain-containing protein [Flocculibacter collagenilyticus]|uniref:prepilin-type N-terminal cleavage/methylation domain-containing protein n=1 Tax=Flocculibacter collagenilyticus TaxID=2744479 RepID=UPI0018F68603|nr:prepilin-type N-terminal cleavage/methylation domain-containing protein [Flocculibacter collagenilyticus]
MSKLTLYPRLYPLVSTRQQGFTLIEIIIGMVVLTIVMVIASSFISTQAIRTADPAIRIRAAELGQAMMSEITTKAFDEVNVVDGGRIRCGENGTTCTTTVANCTGVIPTYVEEGVGNRQAFDDVDDYHCLTLQGNNLYTASPTLDNLYDGFEVEVTVLPDSTTAMNASNVKRISVTVTAPNGEQFTFARQRYNY